MAKIDTLTDNFNDNSINASLWNDDGATETGGQMSILAATGQGTYNGIASGVGYDLTDSSVFIQLVNAGDTSLSFTTFIIEMYDTADIYWAIEYGATDEIVAYKSPDSSTYTEIYRATYNSSVHKWFRIREASGTMYWDTSADGLNWTNRASSVTTGYTLTSLVAFFGVENPGSGSTSVVFDNFNVAPPATTTDIKKLSSIAEASLKKVSGIAIASVKKVSGVSNVQFIQ